MDTIYESINAAYDSFMSKLLIDRKTGILGLITNPAYSVLKGSIRFSGYPFLGSRYTDSSPKILVVGLDIGLDELKDGNTYHSLKSRNGKIEPQKQSDNHYNKHISGTYGIAMYLLKNSYGWEDVWNTYFSGKNTTFENLINKYGPSVLPYDVLSHIALTNIHKFVTVNRISRSGNENRVWYNPDLEKDFFIKEVDILSPDIILIQGQSSFDRGLLEILKNKGVKLVLADHPSSWRNGAHKPTYVSKLKYINW